MPSALVVVIVVPIPVLPPWVSPIRTFTEPLSVTFASRSAIETISEPPPELAVASTLCSASASSLTDVAPMVLPSPMMADVSLSISVSRSAEP